MMFTDEAINELESIADLVRWGASRFQEAQLIYGHGTDNALDESYNLVRYALHLPHEIPAYMIHAKITKSEREAVIKLLQERITTRKPAPYLINQTHFAGLDFYVDERVLIPRSPISELIDAHFEPWVNPEGVHKILDLCTGGGCIAVACTLAFPDADVDATDISPEALEVAKINVERYGLQNQVHLHLSDVFSNLSKSEQYDVIVSNPPYVNAEDMASLAQEFLHEPALALQAGEDGLDVVRRILAEANDFLAPEGILVVEVGNSYVDLLKQYPDAPFIWPEFAKGGHGVFILTKEQLQQM